MHWGGDIGEILEVVTCVIGANRSFLKYAWGLVYTWLGPAKYCMQSSHNGRGSCARYSCLFVRARVSIRMLQYIYIFIYTYLYIYIYIYIYI